MATEFERKGGRVKRFIETQKKKLIPSDQQRHGPKEKTASRTPRKNVKHG